MASAALTVRLLISQEHRHSFVRKNAVMAVFTIYKNFEFLIPDAPELIQTFMAAVCILLSAVRLVEFSS